jgi:type I restriction enzyme R subunit
MAGHEKRFQNAFIAGLQNNGWTYSGSEGCPDYDKGSAIIPSDLKSWVASTQPEAWKQLVRKVGSEDYAIKLLIEDIVEFRQKSPTVGGGTYNLLLRGMPSRNIHFKFFQNKPVLTSSPPDLWNKYDNMILRVVSELHYSQTKPNASIDLGFFINGIPVGTAELKTPISGQGVGEAENQYRKDRIPGQDMILSSSAGALFHFAAATDRVSLTTALCGGSTRFIPFNTGIDNTDYLQRNPNEFATSYLWNEVLEKSNLALIISGMMRNVTDGGISQTRFPRYHQLDNLKKITGAVQGVGGSRNYLSQHAPGSGKSDEIANLAYALSALHNSSGQPLYSSVIIITNRTVLDDQIKGLLKSKISDPAYFVPIEKSKNGVSKSASLSRKLLNASCPRIMSVTAQTFTGTLLETMQTQVQAGRKLSGNYAIIVDEAHDGETGKQHQNMYKALLGASFDTDDTMLDDDASDGLEDSSEPAADISEVVTTSSTERAVLPELNFFAYTATPNADTLRVFGDKIIDSAGNITYEPFHTYSMHQAREEGYINDVLANYVTHERYVKIDIDDVTYQGDRIVDFTDGRKEIGKWLQTHPEVKKVIVDIVMQKMRNIVIPSLNGEGKSMLCCSSRSEAVAYKHLIDEAVAALPEELRFDTLVAFSGSVSDPKIGEDVTELDSRLNKVLGKQTDIATAFNDKNFRLLIVANKYQVGFDQPKLVCMFLDKPLSGINLIQTTARVNRKIPGKENVYVFDFVNDKEKVIETFRKFDDDATLALDYDLSTDTLDRILQNSAAFGIHADDDIEKFSVACEVFDDVNSTEAEKSEASKHMSNVIDLCSGRFHKLFNASEIAGKEPTELNEYKGLLRKFSSVYQLLSITRSDFGSIRAIYQKYGAKARFFNLLVKALAVSKGTDISSSVDVNALCLTKYEVTPQGSIGTLTAGAVEAERANYGGDVSGLEVTSQLGPVEVLINEINDYPEIYEGSEESIKTLIETALLGLESDKTLLDMAMSTPEKSFAESKTVHRKIIGTLSRQGRDKHSGVGTAARVLVQKQNNDRSVTISIAAMLHKVLRSKSDTPASKPFSVASSPVTEHLSTEVFSPESSLPSWVRLV